MPATLSARGIAVTRGRKTILDGIDLTVAPGQRIGLIGPNGVGKSTLLAVLSGALRAERGSITLAPPTAAVGWLHQEPERAEGETVRELLARRTGVAAADAELEAATEALAVAQPRADDRYAVALERWLALGAADLDTRAETVWSDLGLPAAILDQPTTTLSGGEAARAELAAVVLSRFDLYLLDEPTNDLDLDGLDRLEAFVTGLAAGAVIVSHDRAFLERTVTHVFELDEHTRRGRRFGGGWAGYREERAAGRRHAEEAYERYTEKRDSLEGQVDRQREWARQGVAKVKKSDEKDKFIRHFRTTGAQGRAGVAAKIERAIDRLEQVDKPWEGWELRLDIADAGRSGDVVARLDGAVVQRGEFVLGPVDLEVHYGDRVAIVGANGSGKTTLLAALLGRAPLAAGERYLGPGVVVGELDQARERLAPHRPLLDAFLAATGLTVPEARSLLAKFGLGAEAVNRPPSRLSPGERTRAGLALFQATGVNCLVLDEPTNHLDLPAIEQLEQALERFTGTLLLVSHDRRLLDAVATTRVVDVVGGTVSERR